MALIAFLLIDVLSVAAQTSVALALNVDAQMAAALVLNTAALAAVLNVAG